MDFMFFLFGPWFWLAVAVILALIEIFTVGLTTIWFAISAVVLIFVSMAPVPLIAQLIIFVALAALLLVFTRPIAIKKLKVGREKTNIDALIGKTALVVKKITEFEKGEVKIAGQIWSAHGEDNQEINEGSKCTVVRIEGVQAIVRPLENNSINEQEK
ncbi:MAG: NfeD family protein [Treponema sp.]|jgi:membrane protein implicated in regulation of membrane protease activity|nr:NfeD family protein [Treponema sp.]